MVKYVSESSQGFTHGGRRFWPCVEGDVYGNTGDANVYVYVWFIDSSHTVLEPGQVIANFVTTKKAPVRT